MIDHNDRVRYAEIFERYDDNNDGLLNAKELIRALDALGRTSEGSSAEQLMRNYDADGSGYIGFDEFVALLSGSDAEE